jgi:Icc-related predicted phosphoesterase
MRIVCLSDTHNHHGSITVPDGDLLIHAGDLTGRGTMPEVLAANRWLGTLPHRHKVIIAGNHDFGFEREPALFRSLITNAVYLQHEAAEIEGLKLFGSPYTPWFHNWAFNVQEPAEMARLWAQVPDATDILITHGPPAGVLDLAGTHHPCGCEPLLDRVKQIRPRLHVFGHIHESAGRLDACWEGKGPITFINACQLGRDYRPNGNIQVIELEVRA